MSDVKSFSLFEDLRTGLTEAIAFEKGEGEAEITHYTYMKRPAEKHNTRQKVFAS